MKILIKKASDCCNNTEDREFDDELVGYKHFIEFIDSITTRHSVIISKPSIIDELEYDYEIMIYDDYIE